MDSAGSELSSAHKARWAELKEATTKSFHYASIRELRRHVADWLIAYNFAKQLKALKFRRSYEAINALRRSKPDAYITKPTHHTLAPNT